MESAPVVDCAGRRRSPATLPGYHRGRPPRNKGLRYPPDPPTVEEIIAVMRAAGDEPDAVRLRGVIVVLWRAGLRSAKRLRWPRAIWTGSGARFRSDAGRAAGAVRSGWTVGHGSSSSPGSTCVLVCRSARCSACCVVRLAGGRAQRPGSVSSCATRRSPLGCVGGLRPISSGMLTLSRCRARACRSWSFSGSSGMPTSGSRPCICVGSITPRSCTPSTSGPRR
jgi:hypothetical protein